MVASAQETAEEISALLQATDDLTRGESSMATIEMRVKTSRYERSMSMRSWAAGTEKTLIKILSPAKDAGVMTLKVDDNLWNYLPKVDRRMKVPAGMMSGAWMGSHFTNDDLVQESRLSEDFTWEVTERPASKEEGRWEIVLTPKPDAPVVWGKVVAHIRYDRLPQEMLYYDEKDTLVRTMSFHDYREMDGRMVPGVMRLVPSDKEGEFTEIRYVEIDFDADIDPSMFTTQALRQ